MRDHKIEPKVSEVLHTHGSQIPWAKLQIFPLLGHQAIFKSASCIAAQRFE